MAIRRVLFVYLIAWIAGAQIVFALLALGAQLPSRSAMVWLLFAAWPLPIVVVALMKMPPSSWRLDGDASASLLWTAAGLAAYGYWAGSYYFVAWAVDPSRVHLLPEIIEAKIPLSPAWALVYIGVHPFSITPCLGLRGARILRRHAAGHAAIVAISSALWTLYPVAVRRVEMASDPPDFGAWVLASIYGRDPIMNCMPSTHCAVAVYAASALARIDARLGVWAASTAAAICVSTLFTKEHYLIDVIAGIALGGVAARIAHRRSPAYGRDGSTAPARS